MRGGAGTITIEKKSPEKLSERLQDKLAEKLLKRLAGMNCHYIHYTFDYFLDSMVDLGIENIELWGASPHFYAEDMTARDARFVRRKIKERELRLICFTPEQVTYPFNIAASEDALREKSITYYKKAAALCRELGTDRMLITPGWGYLNEPVCEARKRSADSIEQIVRTAEREEVTLLLEHLSPISSNIINRAKDLKWMLEMVPSPRLKAMADTVQIHLVHENPKDYFEQLGEELRHIHFADGSPGGHMGLGDGALPLEEDLTAIIDSGYSGFFTMEIADRRYFEAPEQSDRRSFLQFRMYIDKYINRNHYINRN